MTHSKEAREEAHVRQLLALLGMAGDLVHQPDGSGADFAFSHENRTIGIEHTSVWRRPAGEELERRVMEAHRESILEKATRLWVKRGLPPVEVRCHFNHHVMANRVHVDESATTAVAAVAGRMAITADAAFELQRPRDLALPRAIHTALVRRLESGEHSRWSLAGDVAWAVDLTLCQLQAAISEKNSRIAQYQSAQSEVWLAVVMDSRRLSGDHSVSTDVIDHLFNSEFDRIYLLNCAENRSWLLQTDFSLGRSSA